MGDMVLKESKAAHDNSGTLNSTFQIISQYPKIPVERMEFDDFILAFNFPYKINVRRENEYFIHEDPQLDMTCWGKTLEELFDAVFEEFNFMWRTYARAEDKDLDSSAVAVKNVLLAIAKEVTDHLIHLMANQLHLTKGEFVKLAACEINEQEYIEIQKGLGNLR